MMAAGAGSTAADRVARALAEPGRVALLERIAAAGEPCVSDLLDALPVSQPTISHHIDELRRAGLVRSRRDGRFVRVRFVPAALERYLGALRSRMRLDASPLRPAPPIPAVHLSAGDTPFPGETALPA